MFKFHPDFLVFAGIVFVLAYSAVSWSPISENNNKTQSRRHSLYVAAGFFAKKMVGRAQKADFLGDLLLYKEESESPEKEISRRWGPVC